MIAHSAAAAINVIVVEVENGAQTDVRVSFSGSLVFTTPIQDPDGAGAVASVFPNFSGTQITVGSTGYFVGGAGILSSAPEVVALGSALGTPSTTTVLGFFGSQVAWSDVHVAGGDGSGLVSEIIADPTRDTYIIPNTTLVDINADIGSIAPGTVLWTANAGGDTFTFIPEPGSAAALLGAVSISFVLLRRRR
ncbi:MAG: PEP-CTERM sorting domain-containing protein [Verrucomicrobiota bacterium]